MPVAPDLAKTVKVKSDHSENLTRVLGGAKNGINRSLKFLNAFCVQQASCIKMKSKKINFRQVFKKMRDI